MKDRVDDYYQKEPGELILNIKELTPSNEVELLFSGKENFSRRFDDFCLQEVTGYIKKIFLLQDFERVMINSLDLNNVSVNDNSLEVLKGREEYIKRVVEDLAKLVETLKINIELKLELPDEIIKEIFFNPDYNPEYLTYPEYVKKEKSC